MRPKIGLLMGDSSGIGPEIVAKLLGRAELGESQVVVIGERWAIENALCAFGMNVDLPRIAGPDQLSTPFPALLETNFLQQNELVPACVNAKSGVAVLRTLRLAIELAKKGSIDAICYAPLNKHAMHLAGLQFPDELRFFAHELGYTGHAGEINVLGHAWTSRVTSHLPISEVPRFINASSVQKAIHLIHQTMQKSGVDAPRIAVAALNPHAGEGGNFGREEIDVIRPAVLEAAADGINVDGPFPADTVFLKLRDGVFDAVVTMFHDQGQIAMKLMGFQRGVTVAGGLPVAITTPAHGTAFDIVGKGAADVGAMVEAFKLSIRLADFSRRVNS
jgi:4-hydroxythreonine-4-phosphate dehydrogenase